MKTKNFPKQLKEDLYKKMKPFNEIREIIYITLVKHTNIGDHIISLGEKSFFKKKGIKIKAEFNDARFFKEKYNKIISNLPIVMKGGGYFGDIWYNSYSVIEKVVKTYKNNQIIIMPQSIFFKKKKNLEKSIKIFSKHKNVIIYARDKISYKLAKRYFKSNSIYYSPDSAFFLAGNLKLSNKIYFSKKFKGKGILYLDRNDPEKNFNGKMLKKRKIISLDWAISSDMIKFDLLSLIKPNSFRLVRKAIDLFYDKKLIITSRLHGAILASLLNKPYALIPNNYHKIESFYDSWLKKDKNCNLVKNNKEVEEIIKKYL